jgi:hypothetical protein
MATPRIEQVSEEPAMEFGFSPINVQNAEDVEARSGTVLPLFLLLLEARQFALESLDDFPNGRRRLRRLILPFAIELLEST